MQTIRKAVFPVAGLGTRFLPATKAMPKEMLPIIDKPLIQYAVEEAIAAGITELIFVTGRNKHPIEDHFDRAPELERALEQRHKTVLLHAVRDVLPPQVECVYTRQASPLGLGHAVLCARSLVGDEPFAVLLADDLIDAQRPAIGQMLEVAQKHDASVLALQEVPLAHTDRYGIVRGRRQRDDTMLLQGIVEKPSPETAPTTLGVVGRYVLEPEIFACLENLVPGVGGEIQLTDGIAALMKKRRVLGYQYEGTRYDCGSKEGFYQATVELGRKYHQFEAEIVA
jgi:UTP--glucose-1-phosphate uridylyltransferase